MTFAGPAPEVINGRLVRGSVGMGGVWEHVGGGRVNEDGCEWEICAWIQCLSTAAW